MREQLLKALLAHAMGEIEMHKANVEVYLTNPVGIGEHPDVTEAIQQELDKIARWHDQVEVIARNIAAGSIVRQTTLQEGILINPPIVEFFLKDDAKDDPLLTPDRVKLMGYDTQPLIDAALLVNTHLQMLFTLCGIDLVDFKLEFGYDAHGNLLLADELSPDNMRLWKKGTKERFDKDLFRKDEGDIVTAYKTILTNLRQFV